MPAFIIGQKTKTSQLFTEAGDRIPVTYIHTAPCHLLTVKWPQSHGYMALTLGFGKTKNIRKPQKGELDKAGIKTPLRFFSEFRVDEKLVKSAEGENKKGVEINGVKLLIGDEIKPTAFFKKGDRLMVSGVSKGKGFQGVVKRHGFAGGPRTHGQSDRERAPGSIGQTTTPGRIFRGKRMAGRMGHERVTIKNLEVVDVKEDGIVVKGIIPGSNRSIVEIRKNTS